MTSRRTYKIQFPDGSFSKGGISPSRGRDGKTWSSLGAVRTHITQVTQSWAGHLCWSKDCPSRPHPYAGAKMLAFEVVESEDVDIVTSVERHIEDIRKRQESSYKDEFRDWTAQIRGLLGKSNE